MIASVCSLNLRFDDTKQKNVNGARVINQRLLIIVNIMLTIFLKCDRFSVYYYYS